MCLAFLNCTYGLPPISRIYYFSHFVSSLAFTAEIGYGPLFDPCGGSRQTQVVNFCTVGRDLAQMTDYWCGDGEGEYIGRVDACLSECIQAVWNRSLQRDQMVRYGRLSATDRRGKRLPPIPSLRSTGRLDFRARARDLCRL